MTFKGLSQKKCDWTWTMTTIDHSKLQKKFKAPLCQESTTNASNKPENTSDNKVAV